MPFSTAAKAALCLCPPAIMAGSVATVPALRRAVHHLTASHHPGPAHRLAKAGPRLAGLPDCDPTAAGPLPAVPLVTYAAPIPDEPVGTGDPGPARVAAGGDRVAVPLAALATGPAASTGSAAPVAGAPVAGAPVGGTGSDPARAVPEPASWAMMILGAGAIGAFRRRRARVVAGSGTRAVAGSGLWAAGATAEAGDVAATVAAKSTLAGVTAKALLCACPAAIVAGGVAAVPPLRHTVHAATAPAGVRSSAAPCNPAVATPIAATAVKGFPDVVSTAGPAARPAAAPAASMRIAAR